MTAHTIDRRTFVRAVGASAILASSGVASAAREQTRFKAHLSGDEEVPPVETKAQGQANFKLGGGGTEMSYKLNVATIEDVIGAHIHQAPAGANGGIVVFLFGNPFVADADAVTVNGTLVEGTITDSDVVGSDPLAGSLPDLLDVIRSGDTYVNVHTLTNRAGEIRGQIS